MQAAISSIGNPNTNRTAEDSRTSKIRLSLERLQPAKVRCGAACFGALVGCTTWSRLNSRSDSPCTSISGELDLIITGLTNVPTKPVSISMHVPKNKNGEKTNENRVVTKRAAAHLWKRCLTRRKCKTPLQGLGYSSKVLLFPGTLPNVPDKRRTNNYECVIVAHSDTPTALAVRVIYPQTTRLQDEIPPTSAPRFARGARSATGYSEFPKKAPFRAVSVPDAKEIRLWNRN